MSNIPYLEQLTDGETLTPTKAAALAFQVKTLADAAGPSVVYPISINNGGTGQITQQAAINALTNSSAATTGQVLQRNSSGSAVWADALPYKSYVAFMTQSINAPTAVVAYNTIGPVVWTKADTGWFVCTLSSAFPQNKTFLSVHAPTNQFGINPNKLVFERADSSSLYLMTMTDSNVFTDGMLFQTGIEIRVYP